MSLYVLYTFKTRTEKNTWLNWYMFVSLVSTFVLIKGREPTKWKIICLSFQNVYLVKVVITISDDMDYFANRHALESMYSECLKDPYIQNNSMKFWYPAFKNYLQTSSDPFVSYQLNSSKYCGIRLSIC